MKNNSFLATYAFITPGDSSGFNRAAKEVIRLLFFKPVASLMGILAKIILKGRPVYIGTLNKKGRISIMISYVEPFMRLLRLEGIQYPRVVVINPGRDPNEQLSKMYARVVFLIDQRSPLIRILFNFIFHFLRIARSPVAVHLHAGDKAEFRTFWEIGDPVLSFTVEEEAKGRSLLKDMGINNGNNFICAGLRDNAYYQNLLNRDSRNRHLSPQADSKYWVRNPPLKNYLPMFINCSRKGLYVLRMGSVIKEQLPAELNKTIIDYASRYRTPFGDIYLLANCKFCVAGGAGLWWFATAFNRPVVLADHYNMADKPIGRQDLFIPKKFWLIAEKRFLTFREMLDGGAELSSQTSSDSFGVEIVHNTPEEIIAVVEEMDRRLDGTWRANVEDEELQRRFNSLYLPAGAGNKMPARIGAQFLREHKSLLD